jgi:hypothetical protein
MKMKTGKRCKERILKLAYVPLNWSAGFNCYFNKSLPLSPNSASAHLITTVTFPPVCLGQQEWEVHGSDADSHLDFCFTFWPFLLRSAHVCVCVPTCIFTCLSFCYRVQFVVWSNSSVRRVMLSNTIHLARDWLLIGSVHCKEDEMGVACSTNGCFMSAHLLCCVNYWDYTSKEMRNACRILIGEAQGKGSLERFRNK